MKRQKSPTLLQAVWRRIRKPTPQTIERIRAGEPDWFKPAQRNKHRTLKTTVTLLLLMASIAHADHMTFPANSMMTTKSGYWATESRYLAEKANAARFQSDYKAVIEQLEADDRVFEMTGGIRVVVLEMDNGLVKFRLKNEVQEYWTQINAIY